MGLDERYATRGPVLEKLWAAGVLTIIVGVDDVGEPIPPGECEIVDGEHYGHARLTKDELRAMAKELEAIADGLG